MYRTHGPLASVWRWFNAKLTGVYACQAMSAEHHLTLLLWCNGPDIPNSDPAGIYLVSSGRCEAEINGIFIHKLLDVKNKLAGKADMHEEA